MACTSTGQAEARSQELCLGCPHMGDRGPGNCATIYCISTPLAGSYIGHEAAGTQIDALIWNAGIGSELLDPLRCLLSILCELFEETFTLVYTEEQNLDPAPWHSS